MDDYHKLKCVRENLDSRMAFVLVVQLHFHY